MNRFGLREDMIAFIVDKAKECDISEVIPMKCYLRDSLISWLCKVV